ncbi:MAG: hypothetical protein MJ150_02545, partial [Clostridia bacterium]|nr:hypothetical protein [Clostridia bacterium]
MPRKKKQEVVEQEIEIIEEPIEIDEFDEDLDDLDPEDLENFDDDFEDDGYDEEFEDDDVVELLDSKTSDNDEMIEVEIDSIGIISGDDIDSIGAEEEE